MLGNAAHDWMRALIALPCVLLGLGTCAFFLWRGRRG